MGGVPPGRYWRNEQKTGAKLHGYRQNTAIPEIEECYKKFMKRDDIDIILINQNIAEQIRHVIDADNDSPLPAVLEIPSKDHPYDPAKDSVLRRAKGLYSADDMR